VWPPPWSRRKHILIWTPALGAALLGGAGWLLGPLWAVAGIIVGSVAALAVLLVVLEHGKPDPALLLRSGRPQEAYRHLQPELAFVRTLVIRRPMFREILANRLETMAQVLQALDNEPKALETVTEAVTIYGDLNVKDPDRYNQPLAHALLRQAAMLANLGRHGEALAAVEPAIRIYRRLAVMDRSAHLPSLAAALTRQADELGHLDRFAEARAATAEAEMISTDMMPSTRS
jgi:tetratricopeptide (TPR) repeat protein